MRKFILLSSFLGLVSFSCFSNTPTDSIGVVKKGGEAFVQYLVEASETIYGISTKFGIPISKLMEINPELEDGLKVGQIIAIPYEEKLVERQKSKEERKTVHVVKPGETLYSLSRTYGISIGDLLKWNGMELSAGQEIIVGVNEEGVSTSLPKQEATNVVETKNASVVKNQSQAYELPKLESKTNAKKTISSQNEKEVIVENRTAKIVVEKEIPSAMTRDEILSVEEVYDYDSTMKQVLVIPFDPHLYFSDADDEIAHQSKIPRVKVREVFRRRLDAMLEPEGYEVIHLLGGHFADSVSDLNKIYTSVSYNYQEILYSDDFYKNSPPQEPKKDKSMKAWINRQKERVTGTTSTKAADQDRFEGKYFGVRVKEMSFFEFYAYKYSVDYYVFINQFEVITDYENCLDRAAQNYARYFVTHFTVFNKKGKQVAGNKFKTYYDSNSNDVYKIVADNMEKIATRVINELPKLRR